MFIGREKDHAGHLGEFVSGALTILQAKLSFIGGHIMANSFIQLQIDGKFKAEAAVSAMREMLTILESE